MARIAAASTEANKAHSPKLFICTICFDFYLSIYLTYSAFCFKIHDNLTHLITSWNFIIVYFKWFEELFLYWQIKQYQENR